MARRYLFGPVNAAFADQNLHRARRVGECLAFDAAGTSDMAIGPRDTWDAVRSRLPSGWEPGFVVLFLPYASIPSCLWSAPVPLVGLAADWNLLWHGYRHRLACCDLALTDAAGVEVMARADINHAITANLFGCERAFLERDFTGSRRDIDVLFVGNLNPAVQRERLPWLARLAGLSEHRKVVIGTGIFGEAYRELLARARIVFNRSVRGEANQRAFEAAAGGALLFQEEGNRETPVYFRPNQECVYYNADNLEALLEYYLDHEDERRALAEAARCRVQHFSFADLWERALDGIEQAWPSLVERSAERARLSKHNELLTRTWETLASGPTAVPSLVRDLAEALVERPDNAD